MRLRNLFLCTILLAAIQQTAFTQSKLRLGEQARDEAGNLRAFKLNDSILKKIVTDTVNILKMALNTNENTGFKLVRSKAGESNRKHLLYQQLYNNVPIYDCYYYLHFDKDTFSYANGEYSQVERVENSQQLSKTEAINAAMASATKIKGLTPSSTNTELILWRQNAKDHYKYVYKIEVIFNDAAQSKECMVDAQTGKVLSTVNVVCSINVPCTGRTVYSGNRNFTGDTFGGGVRLWEGRNGTNISTLNNQNHAETNAIEFNNATTNWTSNTPNWGALDVHFATEEFLDYFRTTYNRNGLDNNNFPITSYVHRWEWISPTMAQPMDNAYFDPNTQTFNFGDGRVVFSSLTALDGTAHELEHGFAYFEVGFNNSGEARSLNEGFSDIWGGNCGKLDRPI